MSKRVCKDDQIRLITFLDSEAKSNAVSNIQEVVKIDLI